MTDNCHNINIDMKIRLQGTNMACRCKVCQFLTVFLSKFC